MRQSYIRENPTISGSIANRSQRPALSPEIRPRSQSDGFEPADAHLRILDIIRSIPPGRVCTYGRIAAAAGLPGRARLVGTLLRKSPLAEGVPWHRVVNAAGGISDRSGPGPREQKERLTAEGITLMKGSRDRVDLKVYLWEPT